MMAAIERPRITKKKKAGRRVQGLDCPICFAAVMCPPTVLWPCGHMLCGGCVRGCRAARKQEALPFLCPLCNAAVAGQVVPPVLRDLVAQGASPDELEAIAKEDAASLPPAPPPAPAPAPAPAPPPPSLSSLEVMRSEMAAAAARPSAQLPGGGQEGRYNPWGEIQSVAELPGQSRTTARDILNMLPRNRRMWDLEGGRLSFFIPVCLPEHVLAMVRLEACRVNMLVNSFSRELPDGTTRGILFEFPRGANSSRFFDGLRL